MATGFAPDTQLNWLARYVPIKDQLGEASLASLLEVGSGSRGLSCILSPLGASARGARFAGIDMKFAGPPAPSMIPFAYDGGELPFRTGAFHTVVSMDTLEHVPPVQRRSFLQDLARVASARVIAGFPAVGEGGGDGLHGERFLQGLFRALGMGDPDWLHEHEEHGVPRVSDVEPILDQLDGWSWRRLPTTGGLVNLMAVLIDVLPGTRPWVAPLLEARGAEIEAWLRAGMFGPADRAVYAIERRQPAAPLVSLRPGASWDAVARALVCPDCGGVFDPPSKSVAAQGLTCAGCRRVFRPDGQGILGMTPSPGRVTFRLAPDWLGSAGWVTAVHNYLNAFAADDPCVLWLDVDPAKLTPAEALERLRPVLAGFGERAFAEIFLNDDLHSRPRGRVVAMPAGKDALCGCSAAWFRAQATPARAA